MKLLTALFSALFGCLLCATAIAQSAQSLATQRELLQSAEEKGRMAKEEQAAGAASLNAECMKVVGYEPYCGCLKKELAAGVNFSQYIAMTLRSKEENNYSKMPEKLRKTYDAVLEVRDKCVRLVSANP